MTGVGGRTTGIGPVSAMDGSTGAVSAITGDAENGVASRTEPSASAFFVRRRFFFGASTTSPALATSSPASGAATSGS